MVREIRYRGETDTRRILSRGWSASHHGEGNHIREGRTTCEWPLEQFRRNANRVFKRWARNSRPRSERELPLSQTAASEWDAKSHCRSGREAEIRTRSHRRCLDGSVAGITVEPTWGRLACIDVAWGNVRISSDESSCISCGFPRIARSFKARSQRRQSLGLSRSTDEKMQY